MGKQKHNFSGVGVLCNTSPSLGRIMMANDITGSPSSKYEHQQASALLRNIQNVWIFMGKKTDSDTAWHSNYSHAAWETVSCSRWYNRKTTGARNCLPTWVWVIRDSGRVAICQRLRRVQAEPQSMASDGKGCRDLRPLIRSRCKGVLKQDNEWKEELSCVT